MFDILIDFQINLFAILVLIVLFVIIRIRSDVDNFTKRILRGIILVNVAALIIEPVTFLTDGLSGDVGYLLGIYSNAVLYMLGPFLISLWLIYVDYKLHADLERLKQRMFYMHGVILIFILLGINFFTPVFYVIDAVSHRYTTGPFLFLHHIVIYLMYAYVIYLVMSDRTSEFKGRLKTVLTFFLIPFAGSLLQLMEPYLFFTWTTLGLGVLIAYIFLETTTGAHDYLTLLFTRQSFEDYARMLIEKRKPFSLLLIDLDNFKEINDSYGHYIGDKVLVRFSEILKQIYPKNKMIARLAGDEFIVVFEDDKAPYEASSIESIIDLMKESDVPQLRTLAFSYGHNRHHPGMDMDSLYMSADNRMYEMKRKQ
ncbi:MAG: GGDEF domain-containing protein [Acholeplasmataceae bacterium]|nr:GGDEF domain-containing protein [Acholeplasmataceae bacterium]